MLLVLRSHLHIDPPGMEFRLLQHSFHYTTFTDSNIWKGELVWMGLSSHSFTAQTKQNKTKWNEIKQNTFEFHLMYWNKTKQNTWWLCPFWLLTENRTLLPSTLGESVHLPLSSLLASLFFYCFSALTGTGQSKSSLGLNSVWAALGPAAHSSTCFLISVRKSEVMHVRLSLCPIPPCCFPVLPHREGQR